VKLTSGRARLVRGVLEEIAGLATAPAGLVSRAREAVAFLHPRPKIRKVLPFKSTGERREEKRLTRKGRVALVRPQVEARAAGACECGCGWPVGRGFFPPEWDEFYGRQHISVEETWFLSRACHRAKTENEPSREEWDRRFAAHCARQGYTFRPRLTKDIRGRG